MGDTNYTRGEMKINGHSETFTGFMGYSMYGAAIIIVGLLMPILTFAVNVAWPVSILASVVLAIILGVAMKFKAQWYAGVIGVAVLLSVMIFLLTLLF